MRPQSAPASKLLLFLGLAQLAIALFGVAYALYPVNDSRTESKNVNEILEQIRRNNPSLESRPAVFNPQMSATPYVEPAISLKARVKSGLPADVPATSGEAERLADEGRLIKTSEHRLPLAEVQQQRCPTVAIVAPSQSIISEGTAVKFTARVTGDSPASRTAYEWSVSRGKITAGQGTNSITVDTSNIAGQTIIVNVTAITGTFSARCPTAGDSLRVRVGGRPTPLGRISGYVSNNQKMRLRGIAVKVQQGTISRTARTNDNGYFELDNLPQGGYLITVDSPEYEPYRTRGIVVAGEPGATLISITLEPRQSQPGVTPTPQETASPSPQKTATPTPSPTASLSPTATPQASASPVETPARPTATVLQPEPTGNGRITVESPQRLARDWMSAIKVIYTPPANGRPEDLKQGYTTLAAFRLTNLKGLKELSGGQMEFHPLGSERREWAFNIKPEDNAENSVEFTVEAVIRLSPRQGGEELSFERPQVEVQTISISVGNRPLSKNQVYGGSALLGISGIVTLGIGRLRKIKASKEHYRESEEELRIVDTGGILKRGKPTREEEDVEALAQERKQKELCHFSAEMDEEVLVQRVTTIAVIVSREALEEFSEATRKTAASEVNVRRKLIIQVIPKANFEVVEKGRVEIAPPKPGAPERLYFDVRPTHAGEGEIWLVAQQGQVTLVTLKLTPKIVTSRESAELRRTSATAATPEATELAEPLHQLSIFEVRKGEDVSFMYLLQSPLLDILKTYWSSPIKGDREQYVENLYREIEERWESNRDADKAQDFAAELRAFGGQLFDELFPVELQRVLWEHRREIKSIMVISTEPFIPWELVHLKSPGQPRLPDEEIFLGQMGLVRWLHDAGWPPDRLRIRKKRVRYVIPKYPDQRYKLLEAEEEAKFLKAKFKAVEVEPQPNPVRSLISQPGGFDLLHFACHGAAEQDNISNGRLLLEGRVENGQYVPAFLSTTIAEQYSRLRAEDNRPMVVVNACQAGRAGYKLSGVGGFAQAFLTGGAGAFVGTLWSVGDSPARIFTETLYKELLNGSNLSEAAIKARAEARKEGVATWLAYVVYGHPHMKISD